MVNREWLQVMVVMGNEAERWHVSTHHGNGLKLRMTEIEEYVGERPRQWPLGSD